MIGQKAFPIIAGFISLSIGVIVICGWALDLPSLTYLIPNASSMKFNTALGFSFLGLALILSAYDSFERFLSAITLPTMLIGVISFLEYFIGLDVGLDHFFVKDLITPEYPGRPSPITSLCFIFCSYGFIMASSRGRSDRMSLWQFLIIITFAAALRSFLGYLFGVPAQFGLSIHTGMAIHTSFCFMIISAGMISIHRNRGVFSLILTKDHTGGLTRKFLVTCLVIVPVFQNLLIVLHQNEFLVKDVTFTLINLLDITLLGFVFFRAIWEVTQQLELRMKVEKDLLAEKELREKFVFTLNHDLKTPITAAKLNLQILERKSAGNLETSKISFVLSQLSRVENMVNNLLDVNSIESNTGFPISRSHCNLNDIIKRAIENLTTIFGNRFEFRETSDVVGDWDCINLQRVVENLGSNAIKYGASDQSVEVSLSATSTLARIKVRNSGSVIGPEEIGSLFDLFKRGEGALSSRSAGWGVGLAFVKAISDAHGGTVEVESSELGGTTFIVSLPYVSQA